MVDRALTRMMETKGMNTPNSSVQQGSDYVFADLDLPEAEGARPTMRKPLIHGRRSGLGLVDAPTGVL